MNADTNDRLSMLLGQTGIGNHRAFADLYRMTSSRLFGVALRMLRREDWAEEVLQDCFVSIWHHAADYAADKSAPLTWMTSIVRNRCLDRLQRVHPEITGEAFDVAVDQWEDENVNLLQSLSAAEDAAALSRCLAALERRQRQSIALAYFHGLTHAELASHLREPLGTVKTWIRRGLEKLRGCLKGES